MLGKKNIECGYLRHKEIRNAKKKKKSLFSWYGRIGYIIYSYLLNC